MQQQNESDEKLKSSTGKSSGGETRWGGASKKKGSVTSYAKDVQERHKKLSSTVRDPSKRATAAARRSQREQSNAQAGFGGKGKYCLVQYRGVARVDQCSVALSCNIVFINTLFCSCHTLSLIFDFCWCVISSICFVHLLCFLFV
jgi:hypothetical protein